MLRARTCREFQVKEGEFREFREPGMEIWVPEGEFREFREQGTEIWALEGEFRGFQGRGALQMVQIDYLQ
jgi:hypothetical protein